MFLIDTTINPITIVKDCKLCITISGLVSEKWLLYITCKWAIFDVSSTSTGRSSFSLSFKFSLALSRSDWRFWRRAARRSLANLSCLSRSCFNLFGKVIRFIKLTTALIRRTIIYQSNRYPFSHALIGSHNSRYPRLLVNIEAEAKMTGTARVKCIVPKQTKYQHSFIAQMSNKTLTLELYYSFLLLLHI